MRIQRHALWRQHRIFLFFLTLDELVFVVREVEDVHPGGPWIGYDGSPLRIHCDAIRTNHHPVVGFAGDHIQKPGPESRPSQHFLFRAEDALEGQLAPAFQQQIGGARHARSAIFFRCAQRGEQKQDETGNSAPAQDCSYHPG